MTIQGKGYQCQWREKVINDSGERRLSITVEGEGYQ